MRSWQLIKMEEKSRGGWLVSQFSVIFPIFESYPNTEYHLNDTFTFDRCHHSLVAVTSVKYQCGLSIIICALAISEISLTEKSINGASVTPTPGPAWFVWCIYYQGPFDTAASTVCGGYHIFCISVVHNQHRHPVIINFAWSSHRNLPFGVSRGSVLGPLLTLCT